MSDNERNIVNNGGNGTEDIDGDSVLTRQARAEILVRQQPVNIQKGTIVYVIDGTKVAPST